MIVCCIVASFFPASGAQNKDNKPKETELASLRQLLDLTRDSLQNDIADRWRAKQHYVEQRETEKEDLSRLKELQEQAFTEASRVKEECFSKEKMVEEESGSTTSKQDEWRSVAAALDEIFGKESQTIIEAYPLDCESRRLDLEAVRQGFQKKQDAAIALNQFIDYKTKYINYGNILGVFKQTVLPEDGKARLLTIARFGNVFGYGMNENGEFFFIRESGRLGADKYRIDKIASSKMYDALIAAFPKWVASGTISGAVPTDVMQNEQTKLLIAGKKITKSQQFISSIKAGGVVMVPLLLLPVWAFVLIVLKLVQFGRRRSLYAKQYKKVIGFMDSNDPAQALSYIKSCKGTVAAILEQCLSHPHNTREAMEKSIREILINEVPQLGRYLNTLAVIAGAAPLLGLLGTISGMISLFGAVTHYGTGDPKFLAGGISEALITAKTGLAVAIPVLFIHDYLRNKKDQLQADIEKYAFRILNKMWPG
jgi:Biopolymer transport proteins